MQAPIFHVNGNDAEAVIFISQLAFDYRMEFKKDVVIDLVCFRRYGHNESDEPLATQPMMYKKIKDQHGPRRIYAAKLVAEGVMAEGEPEEMAETYLNALEGDQTMSRPLLSQSGVDYLAALDWQFGNRITTLLLSSFSWMTFPLIRDPSLKKKTPVSIRNVGLISTFVSL